MLNSFCLWSHRWNLISACCFISSISARNVLPPTETRFRYFGPASWSNLRSFFFFDFLRFDYCFDGRSSSLAEFITEVFLISMEYTLRYPRRNVAAFISILPRFTLHLLHPGVFINLSKEIFFSVKNWNDLSNSFLHFAKKHPQLFFFLFPSCSFPWRHGTCLTFLSYIGL